MKNSDSILNKINEQLWKLSGGDYIIIQSCQPVIKNRFALIGLLVCLNFLLCFLCGIYTVYHFFGNIYLSLPIALFFSWMVINIYLVLLTTLSKNKLPHVVDSAAAKVSTTIRVFFILFIAMIISKPIECMLFEHHPYMVENISKHRERLVNEILKSSENPTFFDKEVIESKINNNYFFSFRLKEINSVPSAWFITIVIITLFLLPSLITFLMKGTNPYYNKKGLLEKNLINKEYVEFLQSYRNLFEKNIGRPIEFQPVCIVDEEISVEHQAGLFKKKKISKCYPSKNPPFNTKPLIPNREYKDEKTFIDLIYGGAFK
jgi:hypothetical protein